MTILSYFARRRELQREAASIRLHKRNLARLAKRREDARYHYLLQARLVRVAAYLEMERLSRDVELMFPMATETAGARGRVRFV